MVHRDCSFVVFLCRSSDSNAAICLSIRASFASAFSDVTRSSFISNLFGEMSARLALYHPHRLVRHDTTPNDEACPRATLRAGRCGSLTALPAGPSQIDNVVDAMDTLGVHVTFSTRHQ
jgi:hypothetical protein